MKPHCCPVCKGRGLVPSGFYVMSREMAQTTTYTGPETCHTCNGAGILWGNDPNDNPGIRPGSYYGTGLGY